MVPEPLPPARRPRLCSRARPAVRAALTLAMVWVLAPIFSACDSGPAGPQGLGDYILADSQVVVDFWPYSSAACADIAAKADTVPAADTIAPPGARADIPVTSTGCYLVAVRITDTLGAPVRAFRRRFAIYDEVDGGKSRGKVSHLYWDFKGDLGQPVPPGRYYWWLDFDLGPGRAAKFTLDTRVALGP